MKSLVGLLLAICIAVPACSAENSSAPTAAASNSGAAPSVAAPADTGSDPGVDAAPMADGNTARTDGEPADPGDDRLLLAQTDPATAQTAKTPVAAPPERSDIVAGRHYRVLTPTQPTSSSPDKVEVAEVFMYSCPHCRTLEPFINSYLVSKPGYVSFVRIPASFNAMARNHAKGFYMAETLGVLEDVHDDFFRAFHDEKNRLNSEKELVDFFVREGIDRDAATSAFGSFAVDTKMRQSDNLTRRYGIESVPTIVINGKYVTSATMTGSFQKLREVIDYLTAKEAAQL